MAQRTNSPVTAPVQGMTQEQMVAEIARLTAENSKIRAKAGAITANGVTVRVSGKGGVSVYGLGRFPVTLYRSQWEKLLAVAPDIAKFIEAHAAELKTKETAQPEEVA